MPNCNRKRKCVKKHRSHDKIHRMAKQDSQVATEICNLQKEWRKIDAVERGDRVLLLLNKGCSLRGIARDLHVSGKIVKIATDAARLPEPYRQLIQGGASPKRILTMKKAKDNVSPRQLRVQLEQKNGRPSTDRANQFAWFVLFYMPEACGCGNSIHQFLYETYGRIFMGAPVGPNCGSIRSGSGVEIGWRRAAELAWPRRQHVSSYYHDKEEFDDLFQAFTNFVTIMEGNQLIRENAFAKVSKLLTPLQLTKEEILLVKQLAHRCGPRSLGQLLRQGRDEVIQEARSSYNPDQQ